jgi:Dolichyl-phosphate-mannose-protein mannosyltransferase
MAVVVVLACLKFLLHLYFNNRYGYFRDEFDYIVCGDHLAWGYVDQPPMIPFLIKICRAVFGDSLRSIRLIPAIAASAMLVQTAAIAREFGGRSCALVLSALAVIVAPQYLSNGSLLTTNCLEPLLWMGCACFAILAVKQNNPRYWVWFGVCAGLGLMEKYSIAVFGFAVVLGLLLTPERKALANKWIWVGGVAAFVIFLPNLLWNVAHHWPFVELMRNIKADGRDVVLSPWQYFLQQTLLMNPLAAWIWITGLVALLFAKRFRPYRFLGIAYLVSFAVFVVLHGKNYYLAPIYPMLIAAGAVVIDGAIERSRQAWLKPAITVVLLAGGALLAPIVIPVFSPDNFVVYMSKFPIKPPRSEHSHERAVLPQHYADQFGWEEIVAKTAEAWNSIPVEERKDCGIFAQDYGQAGAIDFLGRKYGLPPALSGHQTWFLWGPRGYTGSCLVVLDDNRETLERKFEQVEFVGRSADNRYALEKEIPVFIVRRPKFGSLQEVWPRLKKWR